MNKTLQDKNAYLSIHVSDSHISAVLAYSHNEISRHYTLEDITIIDDMEDTLASVFFWDKYFEGLEKKFDWEILTKMGDGSSFRQVKAFTDENSGVNKLEITLWSHAPNRKEIVAAIRAVSPQIGIEVTDQKKTAKMYGEFAESKGYEDVLVLDLNPTKFRATRAIKNTNSSVNRVTQQSWEESSAKVSWDNKYALIDGVRSAKFKAFIGLDANFDTLVNLWANYVLNPMVSVPNARLMDMLRAYTTVQLYSIFNDNPKLLKDFATTSNKTLVVLTGVVSKTLKYSSLLTAVLDGLQLRGNFDLFVDHELKMPSLAKQASGGINADSFIIHPEHIGFIPSRVYVAEVPGSAKEVKMALDGEIIRSDQTVEPVHALTPNITSFQMNTELKNIFTVKFMNGAYVEGVPEEFELIFGKNGENIGAVIVDARFKPVIYGPTSKENRQKMDGWFSDIDQMNLIQYRIRKD